MMRREARLLLFVLALCACDGGAEQEGRGLADVPRPVLEHLTPAVQEQLRTQRTNLDRLREANGTSAELGQAYGKTGQLYHAYELHEAAAACYRNALRLQPQRFRWHYYLGRLALQTGDTDLASAQLERAVELEPQDLPARIALGRLLVTLGRGEEARRHLETVIARDPRQAVAHFALGQLAVDRQELEKAAEHFETALESRPSATRIHYPLSLVYRELGDARRADDHLARRGDGPLGLDDPLMQELRGLGVAAQVHLDAGAVAFRNGDFELAVTSFRRAVEVEPDNATAHQNLASALVKTADATGAERHYREALRIRPEIVEAHYNLATLLAFLDRHAEAADNYRRALEIDPAHRDTRMRLADARRDSGDCDAALPHYELLLEQDPGSGGGAIGAAKCLVELRRHREALDTLETAARSSSNDPSLTGALARLLAAADDADVRDGARALALARPLFEAERSLEQIETLAMAYAETGQYERASELQETALEAVVARGRADLAEPLRANLARYRQELPARDPWPE